MSQLESMDRASNSLQDAEEASTSATKMVAPTLRVEELRDDGHSSSCSYSEEEGVLSHGEGAGSDRDGGDELSCSPQGNKAEFVPPEDELKNKIIKQVEFYFSDANILKDAFLLKHVRRNKQGFVSLKLITSFRKVKSLTKDFRAVAYSLRLSDELEVNEEGSKVRRIKSLPEYDETTPSRTVVAVNLPFENPTIEDVAELFKLCGEITLIRVLRPGKTIPPDVKKHLMKHPELGNVVCAVVEFEQHESAKKAMAKMTDTDDWRTGLRVVLLAQARKKNDKNDRKNKKSEGEDDAAQQADTDDNSSALDRRKKNKDRRKKKGSRVEELAHMRGESLSSGSEADGIDSMGGGEPQRRKSSGAGIPTRVSLSPNPDVNRLSPNNTPRSSPRNTPRSSPRSSPRGSPNLRRRGYGKSPLAAENLNPGESPRPSPSTSPEAARRKNSGAELGTSPSGSPWVQRRLKAQQEGSPLTGRSPGTSPRMGRRLLDLEGVLRQPKGPDGTKGFYGGMGRGKPVVSAEA